MKKLLGLFLVCFVGLNGWGQIVAFDFAGNTGSESTLNASSVNSNLLTSIISRGPGLTSSGNADRFNATNWALTSIVNAVSGNNYMEFTITPNSGYKFNITSIVVQWQRSGTGNTAISLRSSLDNFLSDIDNIKSVTDNTSTQTFTWNFTQTNNSSPVKYRFYSYAESTSGTGGPGDGLGNDIVVNGSVVAIPTITGAATTSPFTTTEGTASTAQTFSISGANLTANLIATAPSGFEVSSDGTTYGSTAAFTQSSGSASGTLSIRLAASAIVGTYNSQNIVLSSSGATSVNITTPASGNIVSAASAPTCPSSNAITPSTDQTLCQGSTASILTNTTTNVGSTGTPTMSYQWYYNATNSNTIAGATLVSGATNSTYLPLSTSSEVGTRYYFCVAFATDNSCAQTDATQSLASNAVKVSINALPATPTGSSSQTFCYGKLISDLSATGTNLKWYDAATGGNLVNASTVLANSMHYYATQTVSACESVNRLDVTVTLNTAPAVPTGSASQTLCSSSTVANLAATGTDINWYATSTGGVALASSTALNTGNYYATQTVNTCESTSRLAVAVTLSTNSVPSNVVASSLNCSGFTANWDADACASGYALDVSENSSFSNATDLFISEYVEGSSNNKYIEIFNGTGASVDLSGYQLMVFSNGNATTSPSNLSGILQNNSAIVYKNGSATIFSGTATVNTSLDFNGDDAVALYKIATSSYVDIIGQIGFDPGTDWTSGSHSTKDKTLVRKSTVKSGIISNPSGFPTLSSEWDVYVTDNVSNLGTHSYSGAPSDYVTGYQNLSVATTSQAVTGLDPNKTYYFRVRSTNGANTSANSAVVTAHTFTSSASYAANDYVWTGTTSADWSNTANWAKYSGAIFAVPSTVPVATSNVIIPANTAGCVLNQPTISSGNLIAKNVTIAPASTFTMNTGTIDVKGDFTNNGTFTAGTGTVSFTGAIAQQVTGATSFYNLTQNNAYGLTLNSPVIVSNGLTMTAGNITTSSTNLLTLGNSAPATLAWTSGKVVGPMKRWMAAATNSGASSSLFPIGNATRKAQASIEYTTAPTTAGYLEAKFIATSPANAATNAYATLTDQFNYVLDNVVTEGYWEIKPSVTDGVAGGAYTVTLEGHNISLAAITIGSFADVRIIKSPVPHSSWVLQGAHGTATGANADFTVSRTGMSGYSYFAMAYPTSAPLPVELVSFAANCDDNNTVSVNWTTASEHNSDYYTVEKSRDGISWNVLKTIPAAGNSTQLIHYSVADAADISGTVYYRLTQVDVDGATKMYDIFSTSCSSEKELALIAYPNPSNGQFTVKIENALGGKYALAITDMQGKAIEEQSLDLETGTTVVKMNPVGLQPGVYLLQFMQDGKPIQQQKLIIE
jgi:hypothetical protein